MICRYSVVAAVTLSLVGCSQEDAVSRSDYPEQRAPQSTDQSGSGPAAMPAADTAVPGRQHQYTSLENCKVVNEDRAEMPFVERDCRGLGFFSLRISDSDARQRMTLVPPTSELYEIPVARIGGGGFSGFGKTAEWRGPSATSFEPDSLIVRFDVAEQPHPAPETSYLLVLRLGSEPCLVAIVPPGPDQNDSARARADDPGACLAT